MRVATAQQWDHFVNARYLHRQQVLRRFALGWHGLGLGRGGVAPRHHPNMMLRVARHKAPNVFYNTGHGHLGWTLSATTAHQLGAHVAQWTEASSAGRIRLSPARAAV